MAKFELAINQDWLDGFMEEAESGLTVLASKVAASARKNAPRSKRKQYASVRAVVPAYANTTHQDIDVTDYVIASMKAQRDVQTNRMSAIRSSVPVVGIRSPTTITGRELGASRPFRVSPNATLPIEGRSVGHKGKETIYPIENAEITRGTKKNPSRLVQGRHLNESISVTVDNIAGNVLEATILADRPYAFYVEKGLGPGNRSDTPGRGFMERSLVEHAGDIESGRIFKG